MDNSKYEKYKKAGKIAAEAREYGINLIKTKTCVLDIVNKIESKIIERGAELAFPVNIALNRIAAHYSPKHDEKLIFKSGDVVKLDVGAHIDGFIADTAVTIELDTNRFNMMIEASSNALENTIKKIKPGLSLSNIGKIIEETILSYGYKPIDNLTGHSLAQYQLHSGISIPNISNVFNKSKIKIGDILAIEPFATNGRGHVIAGDGSNIYICKDSIKSKLIRDYNSKIIFNKIRKRFKTLPFAQRWCENLISNCNFKLKKLVFLGLIKQYPQLIEQDGSIVTQKEHTIIVTDNGCEVITK